MRAPLSGRTSLSIATILIALLLWLPVAASAAPSVYCPTLNATVANGGSVAIDVSACDGPFDGGMSGPIAPFAQHGTVTIGTNTGGTQFVTYAHSGDAATSDQFALEDNDLGVVTVNITIDPPASPITVSPGTLPAMTAGTAFSQSLSATGGTAPYTYSLQSGSLPLGISLTSGGLLSGTPTQRGGYAFTVRATDNIGQFVDKGYTSTVQNPTLSISPTSATAIQGVLFSQTIFASGGVGPRTFAVESGLLPAGISLSSSGLLSGTTSSAPGSYPLMLRVTDSSTGPGAYFELESFTLTVAPAPSVSISVSPASVSEDGAANLVYTVTRSQNLSSSTIVNLGYTGSADASDYTGATLTVTIPSGSTSGIVVINPSADVTVEADETVIVSIQSGSGYTIGAPSSATGTILNDDLGVLTINNVTFSEDDSGTQVIPFAISLSSPAGPGGVTFDIATADGTATAGEDYQAKSIVGATIAPGESTYVFSVDVYGDTSNEPNETFFVNITNVTNAILGDGQGVGTIVNDDPPAPSITSISPNNGPDSGGTPVTITGANFTGATAVTFGGAAAASFTVNSGTTISAVTPAGTAGAVDVVVTTPSGTATETGGFTYNLPPLPTLTINDATFPESDTGTLSVPFTISLSSPAGAGGVTFDIATADGTATAGEDYQAKSIVGATIAPGESTYVFSVDVYGDTTHETTETFFVNITNLTGATAGDVQGQGAIVNDDPVPTITLAPASLSATTVGASYSETLTASGGTGPYTYAATAGVLPDGLTLTSSGVLSGTPTDEGTFNFTITATDSSGGTGPYSGGRAYTIDVAAPVITVSPATLPPATQGVPYAQTITASGGTAPYSYSVTAGGLPSGLSLSSSGVLSGSPTVNGTFNFTVTATDSSTGSGPYGGSQAYSFQINAGVPPMVGSVSVPANGYYRAGDALSFTVNFNETVLVNTSGGSPSLPVVIGAATVDAIYVSGSGSTALVFQYVVNPGDLDLNGIQVGGAIGLNGGAIANVFGTPADLALNGVGSTAGVLVDTIAPTVTSSAVSGSPAPDAVAIDFLVTFSKPVNGVDSSDFVLTTTGSAMGTISGVATSDNVTYTVSVTGVSGIGSLRLDVLADGSITDTPGNPMAAAYASGTPWVRSGSSNASLAGLAPSVGALAPVFDAATFGYTVAVVNSVASLTLTPIADDANATITVNGTAVASGSASQPLVLAVGSTAIPVVVTAQDGTTVLTYTVTVTRAASTNASLAGLSPSIGSLDPVFDTATFGYAVAVDNSVASLTLTPTADDANATITVSGTSVASGNASQPLALAVGTTAIPVIVTAQDGATTQTYTVTVNRALPAPTVQSRTIEINAGQTASVELTEGATGGPFTGAAIVDISDSGAGSAHIEQNGQSFLLIFASSPTFSGGADVRFTLSNAYGTSAPGTISFTVLARPDPSQDAEVIGLLKAQVDTAKRFAQVQTRNFNGRLEQLHDEGDRRRNSMNVRLGYNEEAGSGNDRTVRALNEAGADVPGLLGYASQSSGGAGGAGLAADKASGSGASNGEGMNLGRYAIWTGGFVDFSESDNGGIDLDSTLVGVSAGVDYRFSDKFIGGFGVGFGRDRTDVGANGTENTGRAYSAALYGSYKPADNFFIDGLIGASWLDFDSRRYITATGDFATGSRSGQQVFGSLSAAYEFRNERWLVSPYGRVELSRTWLDGFTEEGGGAFGLRYGDQDIDTVSGVIGLRAAYAFKTGWGTLTPGARIEYTHDFAGSSRIDLGYIDLANLPYWLDIEASRRDYVTLGVSLDAELDLDWTVRFDYRTAFGNDNQDHAFGLKVGKAF